MTTRVKAKTERVLTVYEAEDGFRWNIRVNGRKAAESSVSYPNQYAAKKAARTYGVGDGFPVLMRWWDNHVGIWAQEKIR